MNPDFDRTRQIDIPRDPETGRMWRDLLPPEDLEELMRRLDEEDRECAKDLSGRVTPEGFNIDQS